MKKMKKLFAVLLTLAMVLGMSMTSFAKDDNGKPTITVNHASENAKFAIKKLVKADPTKETGWTFETGVYDTYFKTAFNEVDEQTIIKAMIYAKDSTDTKGQEMSGFAGMYADALKAVYNDMPATAPDTAVGSPISVTEGVGVYFVKGYEAGYTYNPMAAYIKFGSYNTETGVPDDPEDASIDAKRIKQTISKSAKDADRVTAIGKTETFFVDSEVPFIPTTDTNRSYIFNDTITGATYTTVTEGDNQGKVELTVTIGSGANAVQLTFYGTVTDNGNGTQSIRADLSSLLKNNAYANKSIRIAYTALVTKTKVGNDAEMGDSTHDGKTKFGSDHEDLFTGSLTMTKYAQNGTTTLSGAGFEVFDQDNNKLKFDRESDGVYVYNPNGSVTEVFTKADGTVTVKGLECGIYTMKETTAPDGYSLNTETKNFEIKLVAGKDKAESETDIINGVNTINDTKLSALPSTGGIGTTIFTIAGCVIMIAAAGLFFASRKKSDNK